MSVLTPAIRLRQIKTLTSASIRARYRNSFAGLLWVVVSPVIMFTAQAYAFKFVMRVQVENYLFFLMTGLLPWIFFSQSISMGITLFTSNARMFKSFPIHPLSSLIAMIADNLINFALALIILISAFMIFGVAHIPSHLLLLPIPFFSLFLATLALGWLLAILQVFFGDTKFVFDFIIGVAFYVTPIFYPIEFVDYSYRWLIELNPLTILIMPIQRLSQAHLGENYFLAVLYSYAVSVFLLALSYYLWTRLKNRFYFRL